MCSSSRTTEDAQSRGGPDAHFEAEDLNEPHRLNRAELSDFIRNLDLLKTDSKASGIQTVAMKLIPTRRQGYREQDL
ncbi:hypothetical protein TNCV_1281541 [Trichonephila clavipes]|nr:hypothetical protein TNCV_1281541 [Trichonephila clavipes]